MTKDEFLMMWKRGKSLSLRWEHRSRNSGRARLLRVIQILAVVVVAPLSTLPLIGPPFWRHPGPSQVVNGQTPRLSYCAAFGEFEKVPLVDGSTLLLNSTACASVEISPTLRSVHLEKGEAIFNVAHDPVRPFLVDAGRTSIAVLGTRFDVNLVDELGTQVSVLEGVVQVTAHDIVSRPIGAPLTANQQLDVPNDTSDVIRLRHLTPRDIERLTAWTTGHIAPDGRPLRDILFELQRYQHVTFSGDPQTLNTQLGGMLSTTNISDFLRALKVLCIRGDYDKATQHVTLTHISGKPSSGCP